MSEHTVAVKNCGLITSRLVLLTVIQIGCQVVFKIKFSLNTSDNKFISTLKNNQLEKPFSFM